MRLGPSCTEESEATTYEKARVIENTRRRFTKKRVSARTHASDSRKSACHREHTPQIHEKARVIENTRLKFMKTLVS